MAVSTAATAANDDGTGVDENPSSQASNNDENHTENETDRWFYWKQKPRLLHLGVNLHAK